jgi:hypothetical protein
MEVDKRFETASLRYLCVLSVSAVEKCAPDLLPPRRRGRRGSAESF